MRRLSVGFFALLAVLAMSAPALAQTGTVTVIHGIPGLPEPVEVWVNGDPLFSFDFGDSFGPAELDAGDYNFEVRLMGNPVLSADATVTEGGNFTAIAHLTFTGDPDNPGIALSLFANDTNPIFQNRSRVTVRHTANAPQVYAALALRNFFGACRSIIDFPACKTAAIFPGLSNNDGQSPSQAGPVDIRSTRYNAQLLAGDQLVFESGTLRLRRDVSYIVYAIGDFFGDSFQLFVQAIEVE